MEDTGDKEDMHTEHTEKEHLGREDKRDKKHLGREETENLEEAETETKLASPTSGRPTTCGTGRLVNGRRSSTRFRRMICTSSACLLDWKAYWALLICAASEAHSMLII